MQIEIDQSRCPVCRVGALQHAPVFHHMLCAYVGPQYDFAPADAGYICPKCRRGIISGDPACEIVGTSARCSRCDEEMVVVPSAPRDASI